MAHVEVVRRNISLDQWVQQNFEGFRPLIIEKSIKTDSWSVKEGEYFPEGYKWFNDYRPIGDKERWGGPDVTACFEGTVTIPENMNGEDVYFQMLTATEVIVSSKGALLEGLDPNRMSFLLCPHAKAGDKVPIKMEAYTRSKPDDDRNPRAASLRGCVQRFNSPSLITINKEIQSLVYDLDVLYMTAFGRSVSDDIKNYLQNKIKGLLKLMPPLNGNKTERIKSIPGIRQFLKNEIYSGNLPFPKEGKLACISHSHLDIAYFWRVKQTVQKNARTVLIQLNLMDRYPEFNYAHSQAWTYEMLELHYPELFERVKIKIAEGRWEIVGAMYVEPDCNVVSAESLIRQVLLGKLYFKEKFNVNVKNCWLPDVFGNSAVLPQILKKTDTPYFVSNKMSTWNDTNRFPHNHFKWKGVDGSEVYACVPPVHFITWMDPNQAVEHWDALQDKETVEESLQMYGYGDGGSGASDEMVEFYHRQQKLPGVPEQYLTTAEKFLEKNFTESKDLPVWQGDLYLEMHRGTFTNKGILKKLNRFGEFALQKTETLCTYAALYGMVYPGEILKELWKILLLNQFHDILPGSHVTMVTRDSIEDYKKIFTQLEDLENQVYQTLCERDENSLWLFNHHGRKRSGLAIIEGTVKNLAAGQKQMNPDGTVQTVFPYNEIPAFSYMDLEINGKEIPPGSEELKVTTKELSSPFYQIFFADDGEIESIYDKVNKRRLNREGSCLNEWQLFEDTPGRYNAWDILERFEERSLDCGKWSNPEVIENGPYSAAIKWERSFGTSKATQIVRVFQHENRIDFHTSIDWQEREKLLKTAFSLDLHAPHYSCDNSAGVTYYENHRNTSWQQARFEVPCHKWVDLSEGLFGVSLLNNCKYGVDVKEGQLRLSLLKGSIRPDAYSDLGIHDFRYSLTSHRGQWQESSLFDHALELNDPLKLVRGKSSSSKLTKAALIELDFEDRFSTLAFKNAEDGSNDIIFRAVEYTGTSVDLSLKVNIPVSTVFAADMLEQKEREIKAIEGIYTFPVKANEIFTIRITPGKI